jgi:hypothetical protein
MGEKTFKKFGTFGKLTFKIKISVKKMKLTLLLLLLTVQLSAQNTEKTKRAHHFSAQLLFLTVHPDGGSMPQNYPWKLDAKATYVLTPGLAVNYDWVWKKHIFWRAAAGFYADCAILPSGYLHIGFRWEGIRWGRHTFNGGFGPGFLFRKDWHRFDAYRGDPIFGDRVYQDWQYRFTPIIGEVEYLYRLNDHLQCQLSLLPAYPAVIVPRIGLRWALK